jgi:riboflavin kinase / FMN adenylyltransferase
MKVIRSISEAQSLAIKDPSVVSIGSFDGVHLGHQQLIKAMFEKNSVETGPSLRIIITFSPHPAKILSSQPPPLLFTEKDQIEVFSKMGIDILFFLPFTQEIAAYTAEKFIDEILLKLFNPRRLVIGYDFSFGKNKKGNFELLQTILQPMGIRVAQIAPFSVDGVVVSSSTIRDLVTRGEVSRASQLLGRSYYLEGTVQKGKQLGQKLGFPTVNLTCENELYPARGVYVARVSIGGVVYKAVGNIGVNPTTQSSSSLKVEFHILDFQGDLYQQTLRFDLLSKLRDEKRFNSVDELREQIAKDVEKARLSH